MGIGSEVCGWRVRDIEWMMKCRRRRDGSRRDAERRVCADRGREGYKFGGKSESCYKQRSYFNVSDFSLISTFRLNFRL